MQEASTITPTVARWGQHDSYRRATGHVLATTLTTMAGFLPLIIAGGQFWPPLAVAIGMGVAGATLIALGLVPAAFRLTRKSTERPAHTP